jgi:hypothetical protein
LLIELEGAGKPRAHLVAAHSGTTELQAGYERLDDDDPRHAPAVLEVAQVAGIDPREPGSRSKRPPAT